MQQTVRWSRTAGLAGLAFGVPMGLVIGVVAGSVEAGVAGAVGCGAFFGLAMGVFGRTATETSTFDPDGREAAFEPNETVLFSGPANHFKGLEGVGGKLHLTSQRLRFRSHAINVQTHDESYPLEDIAAVEAVRTLGLIPNGLLVHRRDGARERFVVHQRDEWVRRIQQAIEGPAGAPFRKG